MAPGLSPPQEEDMDDFEKVHEFFESEEFNKWWWERSIDHGDELFKHDHDDIQRLAEKFRIEVLGPIEERVDDKIDHMSAFALGEIMALARIIGVLIKRLDHSTPGAWAAVPRLVMMVFQSVKEAEENETRH